MDLVKFIEDIEESPLDLGSVLADEQLQAAGFVKTEAFVRTKSSKAAQRSSKHKQMKLVEGWKQLNIMAPIELHETLKQIAKTGSMPEPIIKEVSVEIIKEVEVVKKVPLPLSNEDMELMEIGREVTSLGRWRRSMFFLLLDLLGG